MEKVKNESNYVDFLVLYYFSSLSFIQMYPPSHLFVSWKTLTELYIILDYDSVKDLVGF